METGGGTQALLKPKRPKQPVPKKAVWWCRAEGHPSLRYFGAELWSQRFERRGWSLEDLHLASGLSKSFLSDLENGKCQPTSEVLLELEAAMEMKHGALMEMTRRRWQREMREPGMVEALVQQMRQMRRAWRREFLTAWLVSLLPAWPAECWDEMAAEAV